MVVRVDVEPAVLRWACKRAGKEPADLPQLPVQDWLDGKVRPTLRQLETFAERTWVPWGLLLLPEPPEEELPIPDMRTVADRDVVQPSANLLDTIYACQERQDWYRDYAVELGVEPPSFVGAMHPDDDPEAAAGRIRADLALDIEERRRLRSWSAAWSRFIGQVDESGILVMVSGTVGSHNGRRLDPEEFRGFALFDRVAPLVFVNRNDSLSAQMFTLAHELAHLALGTSALDDVEPGDFPRQQVERRCNQVAAELLVPRQALLDALQQTDDLQVLARWFKVSRLVLVRRFHEVGRLDRQEMWRLYNEVVEAIERQPVRKRGGGNYYLTQRQRVGQRFARAVLARTWEGRCRYTDALRLLGVKRVEALRRLGEHLGG